MISECFGLSVNQNWVSKFLRHLSTLCNFPILSFRVQSFVSAVANFNKDHNEFRTSISADKSDEILNDWKFFPGEAVLLLVFLEFN